MANTNRRYLSFDFAKDNIKDPIISFARGSTKTIIDKNTGLVRTLGVNVPAAFDDACGRQELWKVGSKNLVPYSSDISKLINDSGIKITQISDTPIVGFSGYACTGTSSQSYLRFMPSVWGMTLNGTYTFSIYIKVPSGTSQIPFYFRNGSCESYSSVVITATTSWQRVILTGTGAMGDVIFGIDPYWTTNTFYFACCQVEAGSSATAYEPNPVVIQPGFLIEGASTNYCPSSRIVHSPWTTTAVTGATASFTENYAASTTGANTAARLQMTSTDNGGASCGEVYMTITGLAQGTAHVVSFDAKSNTGSSQVVSLQFNSGIAYFTVTAQWKRFYFVSTISQATVYIEFESRTNSGRSLDILVDNVQVEVGSFPSSRIMTSGSAVTRAADIASINISKIWNPTQGTLVAEVDFGPVLGTYQSILDFDTYQQLYRQPAGGIICTGNMGSINMGVFQGQRVRVALSLSTLMKMSMNGGSIVSSPLTTQSPTVMHVGQNHLNSGGESMGGTIQRLEYWPVSDDDYMVQQASNLS